MAREFDGDIFDFEQMTDDEVREVVLEHLREQPNLDVDDIDIAVLDGRVTLSGRVGTDEEVQVAGSILDDVLGIDRYSNELVVDAIRRGEAPMAADDEVASLDPSLAEHGGGANLQQSDTAEHLVEDLESEAHGTHDMGQAIRDAVAYTPPDSPVGDGYESRENH